MGKCSFARSAYYSYVVEIDFTPIRDTLFISPSPLKKLYISYIITTFSVPFSSKVTLHSFWDSFSCTPRPEMPPHQFPQSGSGERISGLPPPLSPITLEVVPIGDGAVTQYATTAELAPRVHPAIHPTTPLSMDTPTHGPSLPPPTNRHTRGSKRRRERKRKKLQQGIEHPPIVPTQTPDLPPVQGPPILPATPTEPAPAELQKIADKPRKWRSPKLPPAALNYNKFGTHFRIPCPNLLKSFHQSRLLYPKKIEFLPPLSAFPTNGIVPFRLPSPTGPPMLQNFFTLRV